MVTIPFNGSRRILGRSRHQISDDCVSFFARKRATELANLATTVRFRAEYDKRRKAAESDPDDEQVRTWVRVFETVARERGITIPVE